MDVTIFFYKFVMLRFIDLSTRENDIFLGWMEYVYAAANLVRATTFTIKTYIRSVSVGMSWELHGHYHIK